jgi:hypothetical protein
MMIKNIQEMPTNFRRWCKWCPSRWYWTSNGLKFVWNMINLHKSMIFYKALWWCPQVYNQFKEYEKKNPTLRYLRSWNLRSELNSTTCFWASPLMISFEDLNLIFYNWVFNIITKVIMEKNSQFKQHFAITCRQLTKKHYGFSIPKHFLVHFTILAPQYVFKIFMIFYFTKFKVSVEYWIIFI